VRRRPPNFSPGFPPSWIRLAASYDALDASELALPVWDKAVELAGQNVLTWNGKGVCLARLGRLEESLAVHDKSLDIDPRFSLGKFHKGMREADLGRRDAAIKTLQQFLALAPPTLAGLVQEARRRIQALKA
jgi:tetratricopeptide (TPR) repeat protein